MVQRRNIALIAIILVCFVAAFGCVKKTGWVAYNAANTEVVSIAEQYEAYYQVQTAEKKMEWKKKFDPVFIRADDVLTNWRSVLDAGGDPEQQIIAFNAIKSEIIKILFELQGD